MQEEKGQPIGEQQIPNCQVCNLQPAPQSAQHLPFIIVELALLFFSLKLAAAMFFISYCFSKNLWLCPQCKRQIEINFQVPGSNDNLVLRFGNCMFLLTKTKYRIIAGIIIAVLVYSFVVGIVYHEQQKQTDVIQKNWKSLANNCGYQAYIQNPFKANQLFKEYQDLGQWSLNGIYLRQQPLISKKMTKIYVKMNPSQFKNNQTEDITVYQTSQTQVKSGEHRQVGSLIKFTGQWQKRDEGSHSLKFIADKIQILDRKDIMKHVELLSNTVKFIQKHHEEQKKLEEENKGEKLEENKNGLTKD